ncbi:MAG: hypothetical protein RHS_1695 [Robinsoniella sp. RHS]|nr:MAG: hypothetical protein RHS_1695 [Robinsoniella sp. RHS]
MHISSVPDSFPRPQHNIRNILVVTRHPDQLAQPQLPMPPSPSLPVISVLHDMQPPGYHHPAIPQPDPLHLPVSPDSIPLVHRHIPHALPDRLSWTHRIGIFPFCSNSTSHSLLLHLQLPGYRALTLCNSLLPLQFPQTHDLTRRNSLVHNHFFHCRRVQIRLPLLILPSVLAWESPSP